MHVDRDADGRLVAAYHNKCWYVMEKRKRMGGSHPRGRYFQDSPTAYDMRTGKGVIRKEDLSAEELARREAAESEYATLKKRQQELAEDRALEDHVKDWSDWRDPETLTLEELIDESSKAHRELSEAEGEADDVAADAEREPDGPE